MTIAFARRTASTLWLLAALGLAPLAAAAADPDGAALYQANCAKCHGPDGRAETAAGKAMKAPDLLQSTAAKGDPAFLAEKIGAIDKHKMITSKLSPAELNAIARTVHNMASPKK